MKIGVICALAKELKFFLENTKETDTDYMGTSQIFSHRNLNGDEVIFVECGVGKVHAAAATSLLIMLYNVELVINVGVAGAIGESFEIGDIVLASSVQYHDVDVTPLGSKLGQVDGCPPSFYPREDYFALAKECAKNYSKKNNVTIKFAPVISGDSFINKDSQILHIKNNFSKNCAVDMEAGAVAQVCHMYDNVPFLIIRSISDVVGMEKNEMSFEKFLPMAAEKSSKFVLYFLEKLNSTI